MNHLPTCKHGKPNGSNCKYCKRESNAFVNIANQAPDPNAKAVFKEQVGGDHYKNMKIQPAEFIHANDIGFFEGNAIKYLSRWHLKNGIEDLKKAIHFIEMLIDLESNK